MYLKMSCYDKLQAQSKMYLCHGKFIDQTHVCVYVYVFVYIYIYSYGYSMIILSCADIKEVFTRSSLMRCDNINLIFLLIRISLISTARAQCEMTKNASCSIEKLIFFSF